MLIESAAAQPSAVVPSASGASEPAPSGAAPCASAPAGRAVTVAREADLAAILEPDVNVLRWARRLPEAARSAARAVLEASAQEGGLRTVRAEVWPSRPETFGPLLEPLTGHEALAADVARLVRRYATLLERRHVWTELAVVSHDKCRKLHSDNVPLRLLCTYEGPGTQWVEDVDARREHLQRVDVPPDEANRAVLRRADAIREAAVGEVVLLKGEAWPGNEGRGAIHRSPPVEAQGARRLVLKVDVSPCGC